MVSFLSKAPRWWHYYSRNHLDGILFTMVVALLFKETMVLLLLKESRRCLIIQGTTVALIIQNNYDGSALIIQGNIATLLFKELLGPYYSRSLCGVQGIAMGLVKLKDHCSILIIQGIIVVFRIFNCGVLIIQATTVSLLITTNYNT